MGQVYEEENHFYSFDFTAAAWSVTVHDIYRENALDLADIDFMCEVNGKTLMVEYKNAKIAQEKGWRDAERFNPYDDKSIAKIARKFYDSLFYLSALRKKYPIVFVYLLEWPNGDVVTRQALREKIAKKLPFLFQSRVAGCRKIIDSFFVLSIDEWNVKYPECPICRTGK